jgi:esterase/lipase
MDYFLMSQDVKLLMERHKWKKICLLGHSMGGKIAMVLALTRVCRKVQMFCREMGEDLAVVDVNVRAKSMGGSLLD